MLRACPRIWLVFFGEIQRPFQTFLLGTGLIGFARPGQCPECIRLKYRTVLTNYNNSESILQLQPISGHLSEAKSFENQPNPVGQWRWFHPLFFTFHRWLEGLELKNRSRIVVACQNCPILQADTFWALSGPRKPNLHQDQCLDPPFSWVSRKLPSYRFP